MECGGSPTATSFGEALSAFGHTRRNRRSNALFLAVAILFIVWTANLFNVSPKRGVHHRVTKYEQSLLDAVSVGGLKTLNLSHLHKHVATAEFSFARRIIRTEFYDGERPDLTRVHESLFGSEDVLDSTNLTSVTLQSLEVLTLQVPRSADVNLTTMSFGMATDASRLKESQPQIMHWLNNTNAQLHVFAPKSDKNPDVEEELRDAGLNLTIIESDLSFAQRYFSTLKSLYENRNPATKWLVHMDDDTFIPSLPGLIAHFEKHYDHTQEVMVAAISDNIHQIQSFGLIPFGGGGIFVSIPLAESLLEPTVFARCLKAPFGEGDQIVNECLNSNSKVRPTWDLGLNQMDTRGEVSGYFESGRQMLTIHHWKTWFHVNVPAIANVSKACGNECILQRWQFNDNIVLSNGFSIQEYLNGIKGEDGIEEGEGVDLQKVERTWTTDTHEALHHIGPLRDPTAGDLKRQLKMVETVLDESGKGMRQTYIEFAKDDGEMDRVIELLWLF